VEVNPGIVHAWNPRLRQEYQEFRDSLETLLWGGKKKKEKRREEKEEDEKGKLQTDTRYF
jgi:hypothetical protein